MRPGMATGLLQEADPLLELARCHPEAAVSFLRAALLLGFVTGALLPIPCAAFLAMEWETWNQCNRPLHLWALAHCGLNLLQAPVRLCIYLKMGRMLDAEGVQQVITSSAWKSDQILYEAGYAWLVIGVVCLGKSVACLGNSDCRGACGGLFWLSLGLFVVALMKLILTEVAFKHYADWQNADWRAAGALRGATKEVIDSLAITPFVEDGRETSCAVCLVDFEEGESLRQLPCRHKFHARCIDKWLAKKTRCPLCMHEVDVP